MHTAAGEGRGGADKHTSTLVFESYTHSHSSYISHLTLIHKHFTHSPPLQQNVTINSVTPLFAVGTTANTIGGLTMCCIQKHKKQLRISPSLFTQSDYSTHQHGLWRCGRGGSITPLIVHELMRVCVLCLCKV